jgi:FMN phosphatase YigB (HAD superfamily)
MFCGGCGWSFHGRDVRSQTETLSIEIAQHRQEQSDRIDRIKRDYQRAFVRNINEMLQLSDAELQQVRDVDAQLLADRILEDDKNTRFGVIRGSFRERLVEHRKAIDAADRAVEAARDTYEKNYNDAKLQLAKLDELQNNLNALSNGRSQRQSALFITALNKAYKAYQKAAKEAELDAPASKPTTTLPATP